MPAAETGAPAAFRLPEPLARRCLDRLGVGPGADAAAVADAVATGVLGGSTAKLEAVAAGRVPPGADVVAVAERWLAEPDLAWSCWAVCTLTVAVADACGLAAAVVATRRVDAATSPVDFHSQVEVGDGSGRWLCDPYFGVGVIPLRGGESWRSGVRGWGAPGSDGSWVMTVTTPSLWHPCRYRSLGGPLGPGDVEAFCRVSVDHSGVPPRPFAHRLLADGYAVASAGEDAVSVRRWRLPVDRDTGVAPQVSRFGAWRDGLAALLALG